MMSRACPRQRQIEAAGEGEINEKAERGGDDQHGAMDGLQRGRTRAVDADGRMRAPP